MKFSVFMQIDRLFSDEEQAAVNACEGLTAANDVATGYGYVQAELETPSITDASSTAGDVIRMALGEEGHITDCHTRALDRDQPAPDIRPHRRHSI